jgi:acid stress-induced BolA-like protein IbaG/YrbA
MTNEEIQQLLKDTLSLDEAYVKSDGSHFSIIAVSDQFADMSRVKRQQTVYAPLADKVADGSMHAVSIKTFTVSDWQRDRHFHEPL